VNAAEKKIYFGDGNSALEGIPSKQLLANFLGYARELERIV
jgi:hypothetical protein